nr:MAG TPA: Alginate and motility regulator [Bacteriophage sp.]
MSPRTGRPKLDNPKTIRYSVCIDKETERDLEEYCKRNGITKGAAFREGIQLLLGKKKK